MGTPTLLLLAFYLRYPDLAKALLWIIIFIFFIYITGGKILWFFLFVLVLWRLVRLIGNSVQSRKERRENYKKEINSRMQEIYRAQQHYPDVTVRKGDESEGILPKAYKIDFYKGLKSTKSNSYQDELISIKFKISEDFRGIVVTIINNSYQNCYINWISSTISDNHVYIDDVPYHEYMSLGKLRPGECVSKTLRERSFVRWFYDDDILRQNGHLTNNAAYVVRIPITLENGKKIRYKFPIVTQRI